MITNRAVNEAIDYIFCHVEEDIGLEDVAEHCHFSKFYFSRLFKEQTGESVYGFIKRVRLEQSAFRLKVERDRRITEISADYGYSSSNFSSAFKLHYDVTPAVFRRVSLRQSVEHPFFHRENWELESFEECDRKIAVRDVPDYRVVYERRFGSYEGLKGQWDRFVRKYGAYIREDTVFLERTYDDPAVTREENCLSDICMSVGEDCPLENTAVIQGGACIVYRFRGHVKYIYGAYQSIFLVWLPRTGYVIDAYKSMFDVYHMVDGETMYMEMDICVPVKIDR